MDATRRARIRWFHLTPGRCVFVLLAIEVLLWLSDRFRWLHWHKGYAVLTAAAAVSVGLLLMLVWFAIALLVRRGFQFSMRSLLLLVIVVALPCSWMAVEMKNAREQKDAVKGIENAGGEPWYDYQVTYDDLHNVDNISPQAIEPEWEMLGNLLGDDFFHDVICIEVRDDHFTDGDMRHVRKLAQLTYLLLETDKVTDTGLKDLEGLAQLQDLIVSGPSFTDAGLQHLEGLSRITHLVLDPIEVTGFTDAGLNHLANLKRLRDLDIRYAQVTDEGVMALSGLLHLERLDLTHTKVTGDGVARLQQSLPNCKIIR